MPVAKERERTNRLAGSTSPYLLQHARNPVDWYPWGPEALARAKAEDKPIFLSIGYSACHWCHVMERESFENDEIAAILNECFVAIKVDREERPDLDEIYMTATQICTRGHGGWPMSVFLTPDRKPFFAGTYFPPESRYGRPGFRQVLTQIAGLWRDDRKRLLAGADALSEIIARHARPEAGDRLPPRETVSTGAAMCARAFDPRNGGIVSGGTNKFPPSMAMQLMLRQYRHSVDAGHPDAHLLELVELTLDHMARGGIFDQLGGGICRYSTDAEWLVPHFEKMLYDQALVSDAYLDAYALTGKAAYAQAARSIFDYVLDDLRSPEGGFYSARDADSEGQEGKYYVWTLDEIRDVLGQRDAELFAAYYDVSGAGNWHDEHGHASAGPKNILHVLRGLDVVAKLCGVTEAELARSLESSRKRLLEVRKRRTPPALDDKILTSWNGLMIASLAKGSRVLHEAAYRDAATQAADFVLKHLAVDGGLLRCYRDGKAHTGGYLDDYAFFIEGLLNVYEATFDHMWLERAMSLCEQTLERFFDRKEGGFFFTADDAEVNIVRTKDSGDGAVPGPNAVHAMNLLRLSVIYGRADLRAKAETIFKFFGPGAEQIPLQHARLSAALDFYYSPVRQVVIVGHAGDTATSALATAAWAGYCPNKVVLFSDPRNVEMRVWADGLVLLRDRAMLDGRPTAYVCEGFACKLPTNSPERLCEELHGRRSDSEQAAGRR